MTHFDTTTIKWISIMIDNTFFPFTYIFLNGKFETNVSYKNKCWKGMALIKQINIPHIEMAILKDGSPKIENPHTRTRIASVDECCRCA